MPGDKVSVIGLWNRTAPPHKRISGEVEILAVDTQAPSQTHIMYQITDDSGARVWLDKNWFEGEK